MYKKHAKNSLFIYFGTYVQGNKLHSIVFCAMLFFVTIIISTFRLVHKNTDIHVTTDDDSHSSKEKLDNYIWETAVHLEINQIWNIMLHTLKDRKISTTINALDPKDLHCIPVLFSTHPCLLRSISWVDFIMKNIALVWKHNEGEAVFWQIVLFPYLQRYWLAH